MLRLQKSVILGLRLLRIHTRLYLVFLIFRRHDRLIVIKDLFSLAEAGLNLRIERIPYTQFQLSSFSLSFAVLDVAVINLTFLIHRIISHSQHIGTAVFCKIDRNDGSGLLRQPLCTEPDAGIPVHIFRVTQFRLGIGILFHRILLSVRHDIFFLIIRVFIIIRLFFRLDIQVTEIGDHGDIRICHYHTSGSGCDIHQIRNLSVMGCREGELRPLLPQFGDLLLQLRYGCIILCQCIAPVLLFLPDCHIICRRFLREPGLFRCLLPVAQLLFRLLRYDLPGCPFLSQYFQLL